MDWWMPYVGLPFGQGPGEVTCWSLVTRVYADRLGINLPAYGEIDARDLIRVARRMGTDKDSGPWREPRRPGVLDVVLMRGGQGHGRMVCHVGVLVDVERVLHAEEASGSVVVAASHYSIRNRIVGYRRYEA